MAGFPFVDVCLRWRIGLLGIAIVLLGLAYFPARRLAFDRRIESMFRQDDPRYQSFLELKQHFGGLETSLVAYDDPELFTETGMRRLQHFRARLLSVPGVSGVLCLDNVRRPRSPLDSRALADQLAAGDVSPQQLRDEIVQCSLYRGRLISDSGNTAVLWVDLTIDPHAPVDRAATIAGVREVCRQHELPAVLAGGPVLVDEVFSNLERDGVTLGLASSLILTLVIALLFRNLRWVVLPLAVVHITLIWTKAILALSGAQLSMVSSPLVALVTVIGVATVVHITVRFREERLRADSTIALSRTLRHVGPAIFWTCLTTVAGFAALLASRVAPVASFGLMMSLGAGLVFVGAWLLTPALVLSIPSINNLPGRMWGEERLSRGLQQLVVQIGHYPVRMLSLVTVVALLASGGIARLQVATDFNDNFRKSSPIVRSFAFLLERIEGINPIDVLIDVPALWGPEFQTRLAALRELQTELEQDPLIADTVSVADLLEFVQAAVTLPSGDSPGLPGNRPRWLPRLPREIPPRTTLAVLDLLEPKFIASLWNRDAKIMRVVVQARHADGATAKRELVERIERIAKKHFPESRTTGIYVLMVYLVESLMGDQWTTFLISITAILAMMMCAFRSWRLGIAALLPNVAPILMVLGTMGWCGMKINMATAMLASVSLGLSVDFSIHYLSRFQQELRSGRSFYDALAVAHGSVGLAMVLANLALIAGFLVLLLSSLIPTVHFGLLVSVAMMGGLAGNLIVLPLLLRLMHRREKDQVGLSESS